MGYIAAKKAYDVFLAISDFFREKGESSSNGISPCRIFPQGGFYERGKENRDGAVTGTINQNISSTHARRHSSFRIDPDGKIVRFAGLSKEDKELIYGIARDKARGLR